MSCLETQRAVENACEKFSELMTNDDEFASFVHQYLFTHEESWHEKEYGWSEDPEIRICEDLIGFDLELFCSDVKLAAKRYVVINVFESIEA